jgi:hypothetical protein
MSQFEDSAQDQVVGKGRPAVRKFTGIKGRTTKATGIKSSQKLLSRGLNLKRPTKSVVATL